MLGVDTFSPYRKALIDLINSIDGEDKIIRFNNWIKTKIVLHKLIATESEIMREAVKINKNAN